MGDGGAVFARDERTRRCRIVGDQIAAKATRPYDVKSPFDRIWRWVVDGGVASLAVSGMGATFYAARCPDDSPLFVATWNVLATALVCLAGILSGRRFLSKRIM